MRRLLLSISFALLTPGGFAEAQSPLPTYAIDTLAGSSWVGDGGPATSAILLQAEGLAADVNGNLYIADPVDHRVRKVTPDGVIQTVAGTGVRGFAGDGGPADSAQLNSPYGLACDVAGNLYIADLGNARVRRVAADGTIATIAGGGTLPAGGANDGSAALLLALSQPRNLVLDSSGNLYISDFSGQRVYRLGADGTLVTIAGTGVAGIAGDGGSATLAQLNFPAGLVLDLQGSLLIADSGNHLVRKVTQNQITSIARSPTPTGIAFDSLGALYIADPSAGQVIKIPATGPDAVLLTGAAQDLVFSPDGNLYVSVFSVTGSTILRIDASGAVSTRAGGGSLAYGDNGAANQARLNHPAGVAVDSSGNLYIADRDNNRIRRVSTDGTIVTVAGTGVSGNLGDGAAASQAQLNAPSSVSVDSAGNLYIADTGNQRVRKVTPDGLIAAATNLGLISPVYAIPDSAGNVYIADAGAGKILKAASNDGVPATVLTGLASPRGLALDQSGNLYFTEAGAARVSRLAPNGTVTNLGNGSWSIPRGVAVDNAGDVFVADTGLQQILQIDPSGTATPIAGTGTPGFSGDGGAALAAQLGYPWDVGLGPAPASGAATGQVLMIADLDNNRVRSLSPVIAQTQVTPALPAIAVVNDATLAPGPIAPGMLLLLPNTGLAPAQIADTVVLFGPALGSELSSAGSTAGRILSADSNGVLVVAPQEIAGLGTLTISVLYQNVSIGSIQATEADSAPALFTNSSGQAAANNQDGSINSQTNPAPRGSIISLYGTGLGMAGVASTTVTVEGYSASVLYAGPASAYPGLFQLNLQVPAGFLPPGDMSVIVSVGQASSQAGVAVWVD
jgi:trimeric autotransporter adhesin